MSTNTLLTNDIILKEALMEFENNLTITKTARRDYQDRFDVTTGSTIRIRKPTRYTARTGRNAQPQAIDQQYTDLTIGQMVGVDVEVTSQELALQIDDFNRDILNPAMVTLANKIDSLIYNTTTGIYNFVGTAGTAPNTFAVIDQAGALLDSLGVQRDNNRFLLEKSFDASATRSALYNTFNENFNKEIIMNGSMGNLAGFDAYSVQNIIRPVFATNSAGVALANVAALGTPLVNGTTADGATTLVLDGVTASAIVKAGTTFTISGVNSVNPTSRTDTGQLAKFVVTTDTQADISGNLTLPIQPAIILTGPYQTVTALPANNAPVTFNYTHTKNLAYHREAFALVTVNLPVNQDGAFQKNIRDPKGTGINMRMTRQYNAESDVTLIRFDVLPGVKCFPEYASIVMGS